MPTTNLVPSTDPTDLLFNAGKLDEVVNGTANSFTDRFGVARRTVAGMNADFDAQLADAESDLNVYRSDAAASAAEALGYLQTIRATSYGAYAEDPTTDPLGNPPTVGDEYFNTTANLLKRWNGTTWQASDINTANLAASSGTSLVGFLPSWAGAVATTAQAKLRTHVTPYDFGALQNSSATVSEWYTVGSANYRGYANLTAVQADFPHVVDGAETIAWAAIQKFFNVLNSGLVDAKYSISGSFYINRPLEFNGGNLVSYSRNTVLDCDCTIWDKSTNGLDYVAAFSNAINTKFRGVMRGYGVGSSTYSTRKTKDIFVVKAACSYSVFDVLHASYAKRWGVSCLNSSTQMSFNYVKASYCGTYGGAGSTSQAVTITEITNSGTANSLQSSALTLSASIDTVVEAYDGHLYDPVAGIPYEITAISPDRLSVTVRPWANPANVGSWLVFVGGAVSTSGNDGSAHSFGYIDSFVCGTGYWAKSLYGANIGTLVTQSNNFGWIPVRSMGDTSIFGFISQLYCENDYFDILIPNTGKFSVGTALIDVTRIASFEYISSTTYGNATLGSLKGLNILNYSTGKSLSRVEGAATSTLAASIYPHVDNSMPVLVKYRDTATITLNESIRAAYLTGKTGYVLLALGSGTNNQPTGTWTFNPRTGSGWTVNGSTSATVSGFTQPTQIAVYADYVNSNWIIKPMNLPKTGSVIYDPPSLAAGARTAIQTLSVANAAMGDKVSIAFNKDLQGVDLTGYVSSAGVVSFYFENRNSGTVDLASGTVSVRLD